MSIKELSSRLVSSLIGYCTKKVTGQLTLQIDLKDGGIGNCNLMLKQTDPGFKK